jgi:hypothetical protein
MSKTAAIRVSQETHEIVKTYCDRNALKISAWTEKILRKEIDLRTLKR